MATQAGKAYVDFEGNYEKLQAGAAAASESIAGRLGGAVSGAIKSAVSIGSEAIAVLAGGALAGLLYSAGASARVQELNITLGALAKANNLSATALDAEAKKVKSMGIETAVAQQTVAKMVQTQLDWTKSADLARVAQDAAVISGKNSTQTLSAIVQGITEANVRVLRDNGVYISGQQAIKAYAKELGIAAQDMTEAQKQQAYLNAVLEQGVHIQGTYLAALESPSKQIRSLPRIFNDIAVSIGDKFLPALGGVVTPFYKLMSFIDQSLQKGGPLLDLFNAMGERLAGLAFKFESLTHDVQNWYVHLNHAQIDQLIQDFDRFAKILVPIVSAMGFLGASKLPFIGALLPGISPILIGLATAVATIPQLRQAIEGIIKSLQPLLQTVGAQLGAFAKSVGPLLTQLIGPVTALFNVLGTGLLGIVSSALPAITQAITAILPSLTIVINALTGALGPILGTVGKVLQSLGGVIAAVAPVFATVIQQLAPLLAALAGSVGSTLVTIFTALAPVIEKLAPVLGEIVGIIGGALVQAVQILLPVVEQLVPVLGDAFLQILQAMIPILQAIAPELPELASALAQMAIALIPILPPLTQLVIALLPLLVMQMNAFMLISKVTIPVIVFLTKVVADIAIVLIKVVTWLVRAAEALGGGFFAALGKVWTYIKMLPGLLLTLFIDQFQLIVSFFQTIPQLLLEGIVNGGEAIWSAIKAWGPTIATNIAKVGLIVAALPEIIITQLGMHTMDVVHAAVEWIPKVYEYTAQKLYEYMVMVVSLFASLPNRVIVAVAGLVGLLAEWFTGIWTWAQENVPLLLAKVVTFFSNLPADILRAIGKVDTWLWRTGMDLITGMIHGVAAAATELLNGIGALPGEFMAALRKAGDFIGWLYDAGKQIVQGLRDGIKNGAAALWDDLKGVAGKVKGFLTNPLGLWSPSRVMRNNGQFIIQGLIQGIAAQVPNLDKQLSSVANLATLRLGGTNLQTGPVGAANLNHYHLSVQSNEASVDEEKMLTLLRRMEAFAL